MNNVSSRFRNAEVASIHELLTDFMSITRDNQRINRYIIENNSTTDQNITSLINMYEQVLARDSSTGSD